MAWLNPQDMQSNVKIQWLMLASFKEERRQGSLVVIVEGDSPCHSTHTTYVGQQNLTQPRLGSQSWGAGTWKGLHMHFHLEKYLSMLSPMKPDESSRTEEPTHPLHTLATAQLISVPSQWNTPCHHLRRPNLLSAQICKNKDNQGPHGSFPTKAGRSTEGSRRPATGDGGL